MKHLPSLPLPEPHISDAARARNPEEVLRRRARELARLEETASGGAAWRIVEFQLAGERYGIGAEFVREVHPLRELTPLPGTPPFLLGIVNIRSSLLPIIDIKKFFGLPDTGLSDLNKIIVVHNAKKAGAMQIGILADTIFAVSEIEESAIQAHLPTLGGARAEYFAGVTADRLILLDIAALLEDEKLLINDTP